MMKKYIYLAVLFLSSISCNQDNLNSKVEIEYQGFSDTIVAILYGSVLDKDNKPILNATIKTIDNSHSTKTDSSGTFELGFEEGIFNVIVESPQYQKVFLKSYLSHPDQVTRAKIHLSAKKNDTLFFDASPKVNSR